jgi:pyruvate-formate lyase-activating enzyme
VERPLYYVTALSNFARGYDKYARSYDKARIPESSFPERFFLLTRDELPIGINKAAHLPQKTGLPGDRLIALETHATAEELQPNLRTGLGRFVPRGQIDVDGVHLISEVGELLPIAIEEACARSLKMIVGELPPFAAMTPRSVSLLPIARACPARCPFCFSKASVSDDMITAPLDWHRIDAVLGAARARGATRAVITGGGEPTLMPRLELLCMVEMCARDFTTVVLISNGFKWGRMDEAARAMALRELADTGLTVLSLSRHHHDDAANAALMGLDTGSEKVAATWSRMHDTGLRMRWVCVLQRGGVEDPESLARYLDWAVDTGVGELCFKELYVSTSIESEYHDHAANVWSAAHQVPLRLIVEFARAQGWPVATTLPWGAPVFAATWNGRPLKIAAYTEPSVLWELTNGLCRSWNLMADGRCLASLEDHRSEVLPRGLRSLSIVS